MDLFEHPELWTKSLKCVLKRHENFDNTYEECGQLVEDLNSIGYTCEYYLDAIPYNLRRMMVKGELYTLDEIDLFSNDVGLNTADFVKSEFGKMIYGAFVIIQEHKTKDVVMTFVFVKHKKGKSYFECVYTDMI